VIQKSVRFSTLSGPVCIFPDITGPVHHYVEVSGIYSIIVPVIVANTFAYVI